MSHGRLYILDGHTPVPAVDKINWGRWFDAANRQVAFDTLPGGVEVSTVFTGFNYSLTGEAPLVFETMVFGGERDGYGKRYTTWDAAERGHAEVLAMLLTVRAQTS